MYFTSVNLDNATQIFRGWEGGTYLNNQDQIINIGMIGHASGKDTRRFGGPGGVLPRKNLKFEILRLLKMR